MQRLGPFKLQDDSSKENPNQMISIHISSKKFNISFIQLFKHSLFFQEELLHNSHLADTINKIEQILRNHELNERSVSTFFKLLSDEEVDFQNDEYFDLYKLSIIFKVQSLRNILHQYAENSSDDIDFIIKLIIESQTKEADFYDDLISNGISIDFEEILKDKINDCLLNEKFASLPISFAYRIVEQGEKVSELNSNFLYDFVVKSIKERYLLFRFVDIEKLSDDRFDDLYSKSENGFSYLYDAFPHQLKYIKNLKEKVRNVEGEKEKSEVELYKEIEAYKEKVKKAEQISIKHESRIKNLISENSSKMERMKSEFKNQNKLIENENETNKQKIEKLNKIIEGYKEKVRNTEQINAELESRIKNLINENSSKVEKMKSEFEHKITEISHENEDLKNQSKLIGKENETNKQKIEELNKIIEGYKEKVRKTEQVNIKNESRIKNLIGENSSKIEKMKSEFEHKITEISHENEDLKNKNKLIVKENETNKQKIEQLNKRIEEKQILFAGDNEFKGIINYLKSLSNNIDNFLNITSSSVNGVNIPKNAIQYDNDRDCFASNGEKNSWICFEFKNHFVVPKNYTIRSYNCDEYFHHPRSWIIEGSSDNSIWYLLDKQDDNDVLNGRNFIHTFTIQNPENKKFKFVRMRQTSRNWDSSHLLVFNNIEFYGNLI